MSAIIAVFLWFVITSICIVDLMGTQAVLIKCVRTLQDGMSDLYDYIYEPFSATQISLSAETQELVEDLRWKHYPFIAYGSDIEWTWEQSYPYIMFEDGILYIVDEDVTWFIEMQRKEE